MGAEPKASTQIKHTLSCGRRHTTTLPLPGQRDGRIPQEDRRAVVKETLVECNAGWSHIIQHDRWYAAVCRKRLHGKGRIVAEEQVI